MEFNEIQALLKEAIFKESGLEESIISYIYILVKRACTIFGKDLILRGIELTDCVHLIYHIFI